MTDRELMQQALEALEWEWGGEPQGSLTWSAITALRDRLAHCDRCGKPLGGLDHIHTCSPQQPVQEPREWEPIDTAPKGRIVLVYYKNSLGNGRTMRARYYLPETLDSDTTESGWADEGWYEESEAYEYLMPLDHEPTHWMPLPAPPVEAAHGITGEKK